MVVDETAQDRKDRSRSPITAKLVANMLQIAGADHVITMDLHASQIQGFFEVPVDNLWTEPSMIRSVLSHIQGCGADGLDTAGSRRTSRIGETRSSSVPMLVEQNGASLLPLLRR